MANLVYNYFKKAVLQGSFNLGGSPQVAFLLVGSGYTPDADTHAYRSSIDNEIAGSGYNQGGYVLSGVTITTNNTNNQGVMDATDVLLANITFGTDAQAAVLYGSTGNTAESDPLIAYIDFTTGQAVTAGTFQIQWAAGGVLALT